MNTGMTDTQRAINYLTSLQFQFEDSPHTVAHLEVAIAALRAQQERENPKPLTLEELKERNGKPVFAVDGEGHECWVIVNASNEECADNEFGAWQFFYYDMQDCTKDGLHPMGWLAYDHEPKARCEGDG